MLETSLIVFVIQLTIVKLKAESVTVNLTVNAQEGVILYLLFFMVYVYV